MKRLLVAALLLAVVFSGCSREEESVSPGSSGDITGNSAEASIPPVLKGSVRQESYSSDSEPDEPLPLSEPEVLTQAESIPDESPPLSFSSPQDSLPPQSSEEPQLEESTKKETLPPDEAALSQYAGTPLRSSPGDEYYAPSYNPTVTAAESIDTAVFEEELFRLINAERKARGVSALEMNPRMRAAARIRSGEVLQGLSHTRPDGSAYYTAFDEADFDYAGKWHGENVSQIQFTQGTYTSTKAANYMFELLRASSGHLNNMISTNYTGIGIGATVEVNSNTVTIGSAQLFSGL